MENMPWYEELEQKILGLEQENTELKKEYSELKEQTIRDNKTGLYNSRYYQENIKEIVQKNKSLGAILFDINNFKYLNNNFGHNQGDAYLKKLAQIIQSSIKNTDYAIRWGERADEFVVLLPNANESTGPAVVNRVNSEIDKFNKYNKAEKYENKKKISYEMTVAAGHAFKEECKSQNDIKDLIDLADKRMYKDKEKQKSERNFDNNT